MLAGGARTFNAPDDRRDLPARLPHGRGFGLWEVHHCLLPKMGSNMPEMGTHTLMTELRPARRTASSAREDTPTSLADALFTTTQQRLLALLFGHPSRSFFATELIELTGSGSGAVQRELMRLTSSGLVETTLIGRRKHYQANPESPVFEELRGLVVKTVAVAQPIRQALEPLVARISLALIYGSTAQGTDTASSDIDLLFVSNHLTLEEVYSVLIPVESQLNRSIHPTLYTSREFEDRRAAGSGFLTSVLGGDCLVLIGETDEPSAAR